MYMVATLHPNLVEARDPTYKGHFFTQGEKRALIQQFYAQALQIPLCIDHCGAETCGFIVPEHERIGRVCDLFNDRDGNLMVKLVLDQSHKAYARINKGVWMHRELWGVSVWIDLWQSGRKALTHVALTTDPLMAEHGTWLHECSLEEWALDREIARRYYRKGHGQCYAAAAFEARLDEAQNKVWSFFDRPRATDLVSQDGGSAKPPQPLQQQRSSSMQAMSQQPGLQQQQQQQGQLPTAAQDQYEDDESSSSEDEQEQQQTTTTEEMVQDVAPKKTESDAGDQNTRHKKRVRAGNGQFQAVTGATAEPLPAYKTGDKIDFRDFMEVKNQYDIYTKHLEQSGVPYHKQPLDFRNTFTKLDTKLTELKELAMDWLKQLEDSKNLSPAVASDFRCGFADNSGNAQVQDRMLGFVAANRNYYAHNMALMTQENQQLRDQVKNLEASAQRAAQQPSMASPQQPRQHRPKKHATPTQPQQSPPQQQTQAYGGWVGSTGGTGNSDPRFQVFDHMPAIGKDEAKIHSMFGDFFHRSFQGGDL